jgi:hypothetical protein
MGKILVNFIICGCESNAPFFVIYQAGREPTPYKSIKSMAKRKAKKRQAMIDKTLHRKLFKQHEPHKKLEDNSGAPEELAVPFLLVELVVLLLLQSRRYFMNE